MNTRNGKAKLKNFRILLDSVCSSIIVMGRIVERLFPEKDAMTQWQRQAANIATNFKVNEDSTLPTL